MSTESAESFPAPGGSLRVSVEELLGARGIRPIVTVDELAADTFGSDEELEEFLEFTAAARHADLG